MQLKNIASEYFFNKGLKKSKNRDLLGAINYYSKAIELSSSLRNGNINTILNDGSAANVDTIKTSKGIVNMYFNRACAYLDNCNYESAVNDYTKVIKYNHKDAEAYFKRAKANFFLDNQQEVEKDLAIAFQLDPKYNRDLMNSQTYNIFGNIIYRDHPSSLRTIY
jgi:tetratricopeptide (TPR) repeat protein